MGLARKERGTLAKTVRFALFTGLARVVALLREIVAARYFGISPAMSAFTVAFQIPNLLRSLFADSALQGAVVPVLGELVEKRRRGEVAQAVNALAAALTLVLGLATVAFVFLARPLVDVIAPGLAEHGAATAHLAADLARIMFPVVLLISLSGVAAGALNAYDEFSLPAISPALWNAIIVVALVAGAHATSGEGRLYVYASGVLAGSVAQLLLPLPRLRALGVRFAWPSRVSRVHVRRMLASMLPVTVALGVMNFSVLLDSFFGSLISSSAPAAIDKAFRLYQVPQGLFSVAVATVMFPALVRAAARGDLGAVHARMAVGVRGIAFVLLPTAAVVAVLANPITHAVYQRGAFDHAATAMTSNALRWWVIAMPFAGLSTLLWRVLFSIGERRVAVGLTFVNLAVNVAVSAALYAPLGITGDVLGTVSGTVVMALLQSRVVRRRLRGVSVGSLAAPLVGMTVAAGAACGVAAAVFTATRPAAAAGTPAWLGSSALAVLAAAVVYVTATALFGVRESRRLWDAARRLLGLGAAKGVDPVRGLA